jgi:hypothetical protein
VNATVGALSEPPDHEERMRVVRQVSYWHIGDSSWADMLVEAYLADPVATLAALDQERGS